MEKEKTPQEIINENSKLLEAAKRRFYNVTECNQDKIKKLAMEYVEIARNSEASYTEFEASLKEASLIVSNARNQVSVSDLFNSSAVNADAAKV